jgi:hypothetical protein
MRTFPNECERVRELGAIAGPASRPKGVRKTLTYRRRLIPYGPLVREVLRSPISIRGARCFTFGFGRPFRTNLTQTAGPGLFARRGSTGSGTYSPD